MLHKVFWRLDHTFVSFPKISLVHPRRWICVRCLAELQWALVYQFWLAQENLPSRFLPLFGLLPPIHENPDHVHLFGDTRRETLHLKNMAIS
jgi:hypothetical protein